MKNKLSAVIITIFFAAAIFSGCSSEKGGEISVKLSIETEEKVLYSENTNITIIPVHTMFRR